MAGATPIAALALALTAGVSLQLLTLAVVVPVAIAAACVGLLHPRTGREALFAIGAGIVATACYDVVRLTWMGALGLADPFPNLGMWLLGADTTDFAHAWTAGYLYRYFGDGAGLALAFAMARRSGVRDGLAFGTLVCMGLWATLAISPLAREALFTPTPLVLAMTLVGHLVYGAVLGAVMSRRPVADDEAAWGAGDDAPVALAAPHAPVANATPPSLDLTIAAPEHGRSVCLAVPPRTLTMTVTEGELPPILEPLEAEPTAAI